MSIATLSIVATNAGPEMLNSTDNEHAYGYGPVNGRSALPLSALRPADDAPVAWRVSDHLVEYEEALAFMDARAAAIAAGEADECLWLLEHPPLFTAGTSAGETPAQSLRFPIHRAGRGGQVTYHGPGQRIAYVMLDLRRRGADVRLFVAGLEQWLINTLGAFNVRGERREERVGVWVRRPEKGEGREDKIAALGIRVRRSVTLHGISLNVEPDLSHFSEIVPCGITDPRYGVTSLVDLGLPVGFPEVDVALRQQFEAIFGATRAEKAAR